MIAVIADDFTGAAEIGGIGLRHGLKVIIETEVNNPIDFDLLVIATDTRSMTVEEATNYTTYVTRKLLALKPRFIYKKIDSALRGNIAGEITAQLSEMKKNKALLIAANPIFKRIIHNGFYTIDGIPLHQTNFASDPEFPVFTSEVKNIIGIEGHKVITGLTPWDKLPETGLIAGDVRNFGDLEAWANLIDDQTLPAGSSGFFDALLKRFKIQNENTQPANILNNEKALFVLGSTFPKNNDFLTKIFGDNYYISNMPEEIYFNKNFPPAWIDFWVDDIVQALTKYSKVFASVSYVISSEPGIANRIKDTIGEVIKKVLKKAKPNELIIEGGGTTSVVLQHLNIKKLYPVQEINTGIIRMTMNELPGINLTTKPGSYQWPENVWSAEPYKQLT